MKVLFVAGVAPIVPDVEAARRLHVTGGGLPRSDDDDPATFALDGVRPLGPWPPAEAARLLGPEGLLGGLSHAPWFHQEET